MVSFSVHIHTFVYLILLLLRDSIVACIFVSSVLVLFFVSAHFDRRIGRSPRKVGRHIKQNFISWLRYLKKLTVTDKQLHQNLPYLSRDVAAFMLTWPYE
jgi:hypothetical protein